MSYKMKMTNSVDSAKWNRVELSHGNPTTNHTLTADVFKRECAEYDAGVLIVHHELYLGERV